jgi:hypothetical protein
VKPCCFLIYHLVICALERDELRISYACGHEAGFADRSDKVTFGMKDQGWHRYILEQMRNI